MTLGRTPTKPPASGTEDPQTADTINGNLRAATTSGNANLQPKKPPRKDNDLEKLKVDAVSLSASYTNLRTMITELEENVIDKPNVVQKNMNEGGWKILFRFIEHQHQANTAILDNQRRLFERVIECENKIDTKLDKVNQTAARQAICHPLTYANATASTTDGQPEAQTPARRSEVIPKVTVVNVNDIQKRQDKESERCSREVVMDVRKLTELGDDTDTLGEEDLMEEITDHLKRIDPRIDIQKDLFAVDPIDGHKDKPFLIKFQSKEAAGRLLEAARDKNIPFRQLRPSRTRAERDKFRQEREAREKAELENKKKKSNRMYFNKEKNKQSPAGETAGTAKQEIPSITTGSEKPNGDLKKAASEETSGNTKETKENTTTE